jgi:hypothetical protein
VSTLPVAVPVPLVPRAVEVDPETPAPVVPLRSPVLVPSLLGLPLRLVSALDTIQPPAFVVDRLDAVCVALLSCITHPVTVMR